MDQVRPDIDLRARRHEIIAEMIILECPAGQQPPGRIQAHGLALSFGSLIVLRGRRTTQSWSFKGRHRYFAFRRLPLRHAALRAALGDFFD